MIFFEKHEEYTFENPNLEQKNWLSTEILISFMDWDPMSNDVLMHADSVIPYLASRWQ